MLISGVAYYLVPRFFGRPLRWPRLAAIQVGLLAAGITASALAWTWRIEKGGASDLITASQGVVALGFVLLGVIVSGTLAFGRVGPGHGLGHADGQAIQAPANTTPANRPLTNPFPNLGLPAACPDLAQCAISCTYGI